MRYQTIELGCGNVLDLRFDLRADIQPTPATNTLADIRDLSQFPDNTFAYIKMAAVLEHITPDEQVACVKELRRVLVPHGLVWVTTPDESWMVESRINGSITEEWYQTLIRGGEIDEFDIHKGLLSPSLIEDLFVPNGFSVVWGRDGFQSGGSLDYVFEAVK